MGNWLGEFGIEPKIIDYGEDNSNMKIHSSKRGNKVCGNGAEIDKKKKTNE